MTVHTAANRYLPDLEPDRHASHGYRGYEGVVFMPKGPVARPEPLFVKNLALDGQPESRSA